MKRDQASSVVMQVNNNDPDFAIQAVIPVEKLMFVCRPVHYIDLYLGVLNSHLYVFNRQKVCLSVQQLTQNFELGLTEKFCSYTHSILNLYRPELHTRSVTLNDTFQTNVVHFKGKCYFTVFDQVYFYDNLTVKQIAIIPKYQNYFRCKKAQVPRHGGEPRKHLNIMKFPSGTMFTMNNRLYVHNHSNELYELSGNTLKCVDKDHVFKSYYQFCDKVYCVDFNHVYAVQNLKLKVLAEFTEPKILVNHNGVLIIACRLNDQLATEYLALNMLDEIVTQIPNLAEFFQNNQYSGGPSKCFFELGRRMKFII
ncbi:Conserved_hypothetical protein [Hexamita inflata]|uniref:Uncharacterized protein n=1 Tax=Hexamita inflata TaxID=28002 RepID=A0AA86UX29_9EUKA|nr:Conserved hypothetical protein [Hexamita inflata]